MGIPDGAAAGGAVHGDRHHGVRPRWPAVTRTTVLLPSLVPDPDPAARVHPRRVRSKRHLDLVSQLRGTIDWPSRALHACLQHLLVSTVTEAHCVWVVDAWVEPSESAVCLVYRPPHDEGRVVAVRRRRDAAEPSEWRIGDRTTWGWDVGVDGRDGLAVDAERFGWNVADFDLGEPLGYVTTVLRYDTADVGWWGDLEPDLPVPPREQGTKGTHRAQ